MNLNDHLAGRCLQEQSQGSDHGKEGLFLQRLLNSPGGMRTSFVEQLRFRYQTNFQWFNGSQVVTYSKRNTIEQAIFDQRGPCKDFNEGRALLTLAELVSLTPSVGVIGGIDRSLSGNEWWRNHTATGLTTTTTTGDILTKMETCWQACIRNGGRPDFIMAGEDFIDGWRDFLLTTYGQLNWQEFHDYGVGISFHGVPVLWNPAFMDLDDALSPGTSWEKRCYFINAKHLRLSSVGDRVALTMNRANAHAVMALA